MNNMFGQEWWNLISPFVLSSNWAKLVQAINKDREFNIVIPDRGSDLFLKIFKRLQPSDIKVVIIGQDPYCQIENIYDGYAFSCSKTKAQPSLNNIIKEIDRTYPDNFVIDRLDLSYLVEQGVFLINSALSVRIREPESHLKIWEPFTTFWIDKLSEYNKDIVWLLMGNKAHNYEHLINYGPIIKTGHPSPLNTSNPFVGSNAFIHVNEHLINLHKSTILW